MTVSNKSPKTKRTRIAASGTAGDGAVGTKKTVLADSDIAAIAAKVNAVKAQLSGKPVEATAADTSSADTAQVMATLTELSSNLQASVTRTEKAEAKATELEANNQTLNSELTTARAELKAANEQVDALTTEVAEYRTTAKANSIAMEASGLRERARVLAADAHLFPADLKDMFGEDDEEFAEKVKAMAADDSILAFANSYIERKEKFAASAPKGRTPADKKAGVEIVEPKLPKFPTSAAAGDDADEKETVGSKAAAMVAAQYKRKPKANAEA